MSDKSYPMRMCICCRTLFEKRDLLRIVKNNLGEIFIDFSLKASGRGAYICNSAECVKKLRSKKMLNKAFSCAVSDSVYAAIEEQYFGKK